MSYSDILCYFWETTMSRLTMRQDEDIPMLEDLRMSTQLRSSCTEDKKISEIDERPERPHLRLTSKALWPQISILLLGNLYSFSYGMSVGQSSVLLPELNSTNTTIIVDENTGSWIASSYSIIGPLGCLLGGLTVDIWGRKNMATIANFGMVIGWVIIAAAQNHVMLIVGRSIEGFFKSVGASAVSILVDEAADPNLRGFICSTAYIAASVGIFAISGLVTLVNWRISSGIAAAISMSATVICLIMPESATWLVRKNRIHEALQSLSWLSGRGRILQAQEELQELVRRLQPIDKLQTTAQRNFYNMKMSKIINFLRLLFSPPVLKSFFIIFIFSTLQVICGNSFFLFYSIDIFTRINGLYNTDSPDGYLTNIIISIIRIILTIVSTICMFSISRRTIALISGFGSSFAILATGIIFYVRSSSDVPLISAETEIWIAFSLIFIYIGSYTFGFYILPLVMIGETQSPYVRGFAAGFIYTVTDLLSGVSIKSYYSMLEILNIQGLFILFGISCLICTIFLLLFLPETQGKTLMQIQDYFHQNNVMWITRNKNCNNSRRDNIVVAN